MRICLRYATTMNWMTWNLDPLFACPMTQMELVWFAGNLGRTMSCGSGVPPTQIGYMLNVAQLKRRTILCETLN
jgi:hypothetical protein